MSTVKFRVSNFLGHFPLRIGVLSAIGVSGVVALTYIALAIHYFDSAAQMARAFDPYDKLLAPRMSDVRKQLDQRPGYQSDLAKSTFDYIEELRELIKWERAYGSLFLIAGLVMAASIVCICLGLFKDNLKLMFGWVIANIIVIIISAILFLLLCIKAYGTLVIPLIVVAIDAYMIIVVYSYYLGMKDGTIRAPQQANGVQEEMMGQQQQQPQKV